MCIGAAQVFWCRFDAQQMYESLCAQTSDVFCFLGCRNASTAAELINGSCTMLLFLYSTSQKFNSLRKRVQTSDWYPAPNKTKANCISILTKGRLHESTLFYLLYCQSNPKDVKCMLRKIFFVVVIISKEKMPQATADLCRHRVQCFRVVHIGSQPGRRFVMIY